MSLLELGTQNCNFSGTALEKMNSTECKLWTICSSEKNKTEQTFNFLHHEQTCFTQSFNAALGVHTNQFFNELLLLT